MKKGFLLVALAMSLFVFSSNLFACNCDLPVGSVKQQIKAATKDSGAIFSGTVIDIRKVRQNDIGYSVTFKVTRVWKGKNSEEITVNTGGGGGDCGYRFEIGEEYLVYAYGNPYSTNICQRTAPIGAVGDDLKVLGKGKPATAVRKS